MKHLLIHSLKKSISNSKPNGRRPAATLLFAAAAALALGCAGLGTPTATQTDSSAGPIAGGASTPASAEEARPTDTPGSGNHDDSSNSGPSSPGPSSDSDSSRDSAGGASTPASAQGSRPAPSSGSSDVQRVPPSPTPDVVQAEDFLPKDTIGLVLAVSGGSNTTTVKTLVQDPGTGEGLGTKFIDLETSSRSVVMYLPDSGDATVINSYSSPSYAPHFKRPYTVGGRLFVSDKYTNGGAFSLTEYDPASLDRLSEWGTQLDAVDPGYAVVGDQVLFKTDTEERQTFSGTVRTGGDLISSPLRDRSQTTELPQPERKFKLVSSGDALYGAYFPSDGDPVGGVFTVDPVSGQMAEDYSASFQVDNLDDYHPNSFRHVVIDDGVAYWVAYLGGPTAYTVDLVSVDLAGPDLAIREESFDIPLSGGEISGFSSTFDVDGGYALVRPVFTGGDYSKVVIYDTARRTAEMFNTGFKINDAEILYLK